jgi:phosphatidylglycerophosphate synthase
VGSNEFSHRAGAAPVSDYQPKWRRPIAGVFRRTAGVAVTWCVANDVHPNTVSYSSIVAAALAALCFWQSGRWAVLLLLAPGFCYLRLWFNMLDGMVALASGKASRTGEIANELPDRISDVSIFVGVAHSGLCHPLSGYWAAIFALFTAYVGTLGQAVGAQREFSGVMTKPWRMVTLHVGTWITLALLWFGDGRIDYRGLTVLDWTNLAVVAGCLQTIVVRLVRIIRTLNAPRDVSQAADRPAGP